MIAERENYIAAPRKLFFTVPGRLGPWQRAARNVAKGITYTPKEMRSDQGIVKHFATLAMRDGCKTPLQGPLRIVVQTYRWPPYSWSLKKRAAAKWITSRPDADNQLKLICDALSGIAFTDDAQIAAALVFKRYSLIGTERVEIEVVELEP